ncbi:MAG: DUF2236 domain-containing protein [Bacteroidia bacterium]|nr:DUF2236 domain-containing protein [Bacteroidia bacterium]
MTNPTPILSHPDFDKWFATFRQMQDPEADKVALALVASPYGHQAYQILASISKNSDTIDERKFADLTQRMQKSTDSGEHANIVTILNNYFADTSHFNFTDAQKQRIKNACFFFNNYAIEGTMILAVRSLLKQYAAYNSTQVLGSTRMLPQYPHRRILATMDFVLDVMDPNAFEPNGSAIKSIQKLRLVHAMIRARINLKSAVEEKKISIKEDVEISTDFWNSNVWQKEKWGAPINQQDMLFAINTFSQEVIDGIISSGEKPDDEVLNDYYYTWHLYGRALGLHDEINPTTYAEGKALQEKIYQVQFYPKNADGTPFINPIAPALSAPLVSFIKEFSGLPKISYVYAIIRRYNSDIDETFFENVHKVPMQEKSKFFLILMVIADNLIDFVFATWSYIRYQKSRANCPELAARMHALMVKVVSSQATWGTEHFTIADGFGDAEAKKDLEALRAKGRPSIFKIVIDTFLRGK